MTDQQQAAAMHNAMHAQQQAASVKRYTFTMPASTIAPSRIEQFVREGDYDRAIAERNAAQRECERLTQSLAKTDRLLAIAERDRDQAIRDLQTANESIRNMGEAADAERRELRAEVERLKQQLGSKEC